MENKARNIKLWALGVVEGLLIFELQKLIQAGLGKYAIEVGLLSAVIIGVAFLLIRMLKD